MAPTKKIVVVSHSSYFAGAEICLVETVNALVNYLQYRVCVVIPGKKDSHLEKELIKVGAIIHLGLPNPRWVDSKITISEKLKRLKDSVNVFRNFYRFLKKEQPDYVITNSVVSNPAFAFAAKKLNIKHAWYIHELGDMDHEYNYFLGKATTFRIINYLSAKLFFNSYFTLNHFMKDQQINPVKHKVIDYVIDQERFKQQVPAIDSVNAFKQQQNFDTWQILVAGRTVSGKGQEDIIKALGILKNKYQLSNFHLCLVGQTDGSYNNKLMALTKDNDLVEKISFIKQTTSPAVYFQNAHIGVTTSRNEAFGRITVEYMKNNLITIGAAAGATGEIISNMENGFLYEVNNCEMLADILSKIISREIDSTTVLINAKRTVEKRFNYNTHANAFKTFLFNN
jgi:glycosyltransferase involved in cell wall biosynthesis